MSQQNEHQMNIESDRRARPMPERLPPPTVWPAAMALGITLLAFGVATSWIMSVAGFALFVLSMRGWVEDLRNDHVEQHE